MYEVGPLTYHPLSGCLPPVGHMLLQATDPAELLQRRQEFSTDHQGSLPAEERVLQKG